MVRGGQGIPLLHPPLIRVSEEASLPPAPPLRAAAGVQGEGHLPGGGGTRPGVQTQAGDQKEARQTEKLQFSAEIKSIFVHLMNKNTTLSFSSPLTKEFSLHSVVIYICILHNVFESVMLSS